MSAFKVRSNRRWFKSYLTIMSALTDFEYRYQQTLLELANLEAEIEYLLETYAGGGGIVGTSNRATGMQNFTQFIQNAVIRPEYVRYVRVYGMPHDGIFLPTLLAHVRGPGNR